MSWCGNYPFHPEHGILYLFVSASAMRRQFVEPLRSLAWFDNNCFVNAALHAAAGLGLWMQENHINSDGDEEREELAGQGPKGA